MLNSKMVELLITAKSENQLVSVFSNRNSPDLCATGFVKEITDSYLLQGHITPEGLYDGYTVRKLSDIYRVDVAGLYEKKLALIYDTLSQKHLSAFLKQKITQKANLFVCTLNAAKVRDMVVAIVINDDQETTIRGWVESINNKELVIKNISYDGFDDGKSVIFLTDIMKIFCDSAEERTLGLLNKLKFKPI